MKQTRPNRPKLYHTFLDTCEATITVVLAIALVLSLVWSIESAVASGIGPGTIEVLDSFSYPTTQGKDNSTVCAGGPVANSQLQQCFLQTNKTFECFGNTNVNMANGSCPGRWSAVTNERINTGPDAGKVHIRVNGSDIVLANVDVEVSGTLNAKGFDPDKDWNGKATWYSYYRITDAQGNLVFDVSFGDQVEHASSSPFDPETSRSITDNKTYYLEIPGAGAEYFIEWGHQAQCATGYLGQYNGQGTGCIIFMEDKYFLNVE